MKVLRVLHVFSTFGVGVWVPVAREVVKSQAVNKLVKTVLFGAYSLAKTTKSDIT